MNRVAVDVDEVLMPLAQPLFKWARQRDPTTHKPMSRKYPYNYGVILNKSQVDAQRLLYEFYDTQEFLDIQPLLGAQLGVRILKQRGKKLYVVTGRQYHVKNKTQWWIEKHFPNMFEDFVLTNSYTTMEISKLKVCNDLDADVLIDDNYFTCVQCQQGGVEAMNFVGTPMYPWCEPNPLAVKNWSKVCENL